MPTPDVRVKDLVQSYAPPGVTGSGHRLDAHQRREQETGSLDYPVLTGIQGTASNSGSHPPKAAAPACC